MRTLIDPGERRGVHDQLLEGETRRLATGEHVGLQIGREKGQREEAKLVAVAGRGGLGFGQRALELES